MNEKWMEIEIRTPSEGADLLCDALAGLDCAGTTVEDRRLDTFVPPDPDETPPEYFLKAYFAGDDDGLRDRIEELLSELNRYLPRPAVVTAVRSVGQEDWAEGWKQHFGTVRIGSRLVIKPSWESFDPAPGDAVVELDPGMAFGTGTHPTTLLCLEALSELFDTSPPPQRVLDVGTGSGILAIAAAVLGAPRVLACDIEEEACRTARENAALNGVADRVEVTMRPLSELGDRFDIVLANILAEENARLAAELSGRLAPGGTLVLSGILNEKEELVTAAFAPFGLCPPLIRRREEWSCILYRRDA